MPSRPVATSPPPVLLALPTAALVLAVVVAAPGPVTAAPLEKEACEALKSEQGKLAGGGLRSEMQRGAAWGKANLSAERLQQVARLIELDEQVLFRCGGAAAQAAEEAAEAKPARPARPAVDAIAAGRDGKAKARSELEPQSAAAPPSPAAETPAKPRKSMPKAARSAAPPDGKAANPGAEGAAAAGAAPAAPRKRAAARPKADDAYQAPPGAPQSVLKVPGAVE